MSTRPVVLVTGVDQPEGAQLSRVLYGMGYHVVAHGFSAERAEEVAAEQDVVGDRITPVSADLTIGADVERLFRDAGHISGGVDGVVHAAWLPGPESAAAALADVHPHDWARLMYLHTTMLLLTVQCAAKFIRRGRCGRIVLVTGQGRGYVSETLARNTIDGATEAFATAEPGVDVLRLKNTGDRAQPVGVQLVDLLRAAS